MFEFAFEDFHNMTTKHTLHSAIAFLGAWRALDKTFPMQSAELVLHVAMKPGITVEELMGLTGLAQTTCNRTISLMSKWHKLGVPGHDLLETADDPTETRRKIVFLTHRGHRLITNMMQHLDKEFEMPVVTARAAVHRIQSS